MKILLFMFAMLSFSTTYAKEISFKLSTNQNLEIEKVTATYEGSNSLIPGCCKRLGDFGVECEKKSIPLKVKEFISVRERITSYCKLKLKGIAVTLTHSENGKDYKGKYHLVRTNTWSYWKNVLDLSCSFRTYSGETSFYCGETTVLIKDDIDNFELNFFYK